MRFIVDIDDDLMDEAIEASDCDEGPLEENELVREALIFWIGTARGGRLISVERIPS